MVSHLLTVVSDLVWVVHSVNVVTSDKHVNVVIHLVRCRPVVVHIERNVREVLTRVSIIRFLVMTILHLVLVEEARLIVSLVHSHGHV